MALATENFRDIKADPIALPAVTPLPGDGLHGHARPLPERLTAAGVGVEISGGFDEAWGG
jgi:hypothetical protein